MNNSNSIASIYNIVENLEYFEAEQLYLVTTKDDSTKQYWVQHIDLKNRSVEENKLIQDTISTIKSLSSQELENKDFTNLIKVIEAENTIDLVYEKIAGESLKTKINNADNQTEIEIIKQLKNLLLALKLIHDRGLIHQMIKPQNLTLTNTNQQIIFNNYGKVTTDLYSSSMATISFEDTRYITQDQLKGKATFSTDIYALGMVIITSIIGVNVSSLEENDSGTWNWNQSQNQNFSDRFVNIIDKMTHRKNRLRYQNVAEILDTINQSFPQLENKQILATETDYTRTQIITFETEEDKIVEEEKQAPQPEKNTPPLILDATQIVTPETIPQEKKTEDNQQTNNLENTSDQAITNNSEIPTLTNNNTTSEQNISTPENEENRANNKLTFINNLSSQIKTTKGIITIVILIFMTILGVSIYNNYRYQKKVENLISQIETYYQNDEFNNCISLINSTETQSLAIADSLTQEFLGKCWLGLAESQALARNFAEAITIAVKVNNKSPNYTRARKFIDDWSEQLLKEAKIICENGGDIAQANQRLESIPESSVWKKQALDLISKCPNLQTENDLTTPTITDGVVEVCPGPLCPE